jgi:hypothetical protein
MPQSDIFFEEKTLRRNNGQHPERILDKKIPLKFIETDKWDPFHFPPREVYYRG